MGESFHFFPSRSDAPASGLIDDPLKTILVGGLNVAVSAIERTLNLPASFAAALKHLPPDPAGGHARE
jgi:hypothetical protein